MKPGSERRVTASPEANRITFEGSVSPAAVCSAVSVARWSAAAVVAGSAAGAFAPVAVASVDCALIAPVYCALAPVSAGASAVPVAASQKAFPVAAGIAFPASNFPHSSQRSER